MCLVITLHSVLNPGNCFGEEGIELLRGSLEAKGHMEVLGSLSDDEGLDNDSDNEGLDNDSDRDEEEGEREDEAVDEIKTEDVRDRSVAETLRAVSY